MTKIEKTWKREVAAAQLAAHWALIGFICWMTIKHPDRSVDHLVTLAIGFAVWVYGFAAGAFGLDAFAKQIKGAVK